MASFERQLYAVERDDRLRSNGAGGSGNEWWLPGTRVGDMLRNNTAFTRVPSRPDPTEPLLFGSRDNALYVFKLSEP